jgi:addiction module HigA family antidote
MSRIKQTPGSVLQSYIDEYQTNAFSLSKDINLSYQTLLNIRSGKQKISVPTALRLAKYFGQSPKFWIDLQYDYEIEKLSYDKKFISMINKIPAAKKGKAKNQPRLKASQRKPNSLSEKRKKAAYGAKTARGKRSAKRAGRPKKK